MVLLIALNALFVAGEFSLLAVAASHTGTSADASAKNVASLLRRLSFHLGGAQLGITITSLLMGIVAEDTIGSLLAKIGGPLSTGTALLAATAIAIAAAAQMTFGELIPKNLAVSLPLKTSTALAPVLRLYGLLAAPIVLLFNGIANQVVRALGLRPADELRVVRTLEELEQVLRSASASSLSQESAKLLGRSLRLAGKVAADALVPRTAMNTLPIDATVEDLSLAAAEKGHTRFLVTGSDMDDIVGLADVRDVFAVGSERPLSEVPIAQVMRQALFVSEQLTLDRVLAEMEKSHNRLAAVIDEHGGTAGLLTREDIFEEALGNLEDEYDQAVQSHTSVQRNLRGTLTLDEASEILEELAAQELAKQQTPVQETAEQETADPELSEHVQLGLSLPDGPYETLAGFVLSLAGHIPQPGESVDWEGWRFQVVALDKLRVAEVRVEKLPEKPEVKLLGHPSQPASEQDLA